MKQRMIVTEPDLRTMLRLIASPDDVDSTQPLPPSLLAGLKELVPCDSVTFTQFDARQREILFEQATDEDCGLADSLSENLSQAFWTHYWTTASCCYPDVSGDLTTVTRASDFHSDRELHASPMYVDYLRPTGGEREMMLCLPSRPGRVVRMLFWRGPGPDFSERDTALLTLLRPHIHAAYLAQRQPEAIPALTLRQRELLGLVALGYTNRQIARRLSVAEATVRKHLEHVFERLQVTSRTAAVTRTFGHEPY